MFPGLPSGALSTFEGDVEGGGGHSVTTRPPTTTTVVTMARTAVDYVFFFHDFTPYGFSRRAQCDIIVNDFKRTVFILHFLGDF